MDWRRTATLDRSREAHHGRPDRSHVSSAGRPGAAADRARRPLARRRHRRREGHPDPRQRRASSSSTRALECFVDLGPRQKGAHMSRFEEVVNEAIGEVVLGESALQRRDARRSTSPSSCASARTPAAPRSRSPRATPSTSRRPVSGIQTQEIYTLFGVAVACERGTRRLIGVAAQGMTACPCAQELVAEARRASGSPSDGFAEDEIERSSRHVPVATHNQRGLGTLYIGCTEDCDDEIDAADAAGDRRGLDVLGDLRADEALRRGAPSSRRPTAARASSRTACAR